MWRLKISTGRKAGHTRATTPDPIPRTRPALTLCLVLIGSLLSGCLKPVSQIPPSVWLERFQLDENQHPGKLHYCQTVGCLQRSRLQLTPPQWQQITGLFQPPATTAAAERQQIAQAIGTMEQLIGPLANTANDEGRNVLFPDKPGHQLDCVAETSNSTQTLLLLHHQQLLRWHRPVHPAHRGPLQLSAPHFSAVIQDKSTEALWAVDSWFLANGEPPVVVPLARWRKGYSPP